MKQIHKFSVLVLLLSLVSCASSKKLADTDIYDTTWELEYLSGPKIAFEGLFPDRKPNISFNSDTKRVEGTASCNGYRAEFTINGNKISFGEPGPTTMMYCGEGEKYFLNTIAKVNGYRIDGKGKLHLMLDDNTIMRFKKAGNP